MLYRHFIKQYISFLKKTSLGKFFNFFGKIFFGKIAFVTGYAPNGREFYKTTTSKRLDKLFITLKETGHTNVEEHADIESVENALRNLGTARRSNK
jgi:hypothetical protein